jgi:hypothetical protein
MNLFPQLMENGQLLPDSLSCSVEQSLPYSGTPICKLLGFSRPVSAADEPRAPVVAIRDALTSAVGRPRAGFAVRRRDGARGTGVDRAPAATACAGR